jgi:formylglycine-generating enzyme required for sulfatase activity
MAGIIPRARSAPSRPCCFPPRSRPLTLPGLRSPRKCPHRSVRWLAVALAAACSDPGPSPAVLEQLAAGAAPSTWEDLDPAHPGTRLRDPRTGVVFRRIPHGEFTMGGDSTPEERPPHPVRLTRDYLLAETEVTIGQWRRYVLEHGGPLDVPAPDVEPTRPMTHVSLADAQQFCARYGYRLPTEAEWERACRGGLPPDQGPWLRDATLAEHAWYHRNSGQHTNAVATRRPNAYGLHDMLGNVWEYCSDWYGPGYGQDPGLRIDPTGPAQGASRVLRGGSWFSLPGPLPSTRIPEEPGKRNGFFGFRPLRTLD